MITTILVFPVTSCLHNMLFQQTCHNLVYQNFAYLGIFSITDACGGVHLMKHEEHIRPKIEHHSSCCLIWTPWQQCVFFFFMCFCKLMIKARFKKCSLRSVTCFFELLSADSLYDSCIECDLVIYSHEDDEYLRLLLFLLNGEAHIMFNLP